MLSGIKFINYSHTDRLMTLTGKNWSTRRKPCPSATLSTTNPL